jgi:hypothetical protein
MHTTVAGSPWLVCCMCAGNGASAHDACRHCSPRDPARAGNVSKHQQVRRTSASSSVFVMVMMHNGSFSCIAMSPTKGFRVV